MGHERQVAMTGCRRTFAGAKCVEPRETLWKTLGWISQQTTPTHTGLRATLSPNRCRIVSTHDPTTSLSVASWQSASGLDWTRQPSCLRDQCCLSSLSCCVTCLVSTYSSALFGCGKGEHATVPANNPSLGRFGFAAIYRKTEATSSAQPPANPYLYQTAVHLVALSRHR